MRCNWWQAYNIVERSSGLKPEKIFCYNENFDKRVVLHNIIKKYENHSSTIKFKDNMSEKSHLSFNNTLLLARQVIFQWSKRNSKSADKIPTKVVKLASCFLSTPLAIAINNSLASSKFLDMAKTATVIPIDKKMDDKHMIFVTFDQKVY